MATAWQAKGLAFVFVVMPLLAGAAPADPFRVSASLTVGETSGVAAVTFSVPAHHHLYADQTQVRDAGAGVLTPLDPVIPARIRDAFSETEREVYTNDFVLMYRVGASAVTGLTLEVEYQGCNEATCFFPQHRSFPLVPGSAVRPVAVPEHVAPAVPPAPGGWAGFDAALTTAAQASGYVRASEFLAFLDEAEHGRRTTPAGQGGSWARFRENVALFSASPVEFFNRFGVIWSVLLILAGGLLLNLTPCVLPMIPVNLAILGVGVQGSSRGRGFGLGSAYGAGIAVVYGVLGLGVVLTGAQFGTLNSMPWFNAIIAIVFVVLGLAMFDVFQIDLARFQGSIGSRSAGRGTYVTAIGMGGVAALLAGACVAPVVIAVLVLSSNLYAGGLTVGLALPFVLGLGMALPWPLAGAGLAFLPKPGAWMTRVKGGFGVFIMILALYYAWVAVQGWRGPGTIAAVEAGVMRVSADQGPAAWADVVAQAHATGKPVFVDFWATWCKNCEAMEASTFRDATVKARLGDFVMVKCQAERPNDTATREVLEHFGVKGLPTYLVLKPGNRQGPAAP